MNGDVSWSPVIILATNHVHFHTSVVEDWPGAASQNFHWWITMTCFGTQHFWKFYIWNLKSYQEVKWNEKLESITDKIWFVSDQAFGIKIWDCWLTGGKAQLGWLGGVSYLILEIKTQKWFKQHMFDVLLLMWS